MKLSGCIHRHGAPLPLVGDCESPGNEMTNESLKKLLATQDAGRRLASQMEPLHSNLMAMSTIAESLSGNSAISRLMKDMQRHEKLMRAAVGPLADLKASGAFERIAGHAQAFDHTRQLLTDFEARFRLPALTEATRFLTTFEESGAFKELQRFSAQTSEIQRAIEGMRSPWLDATNPLHSVAGIAGIQRIGIALGKLPTFDDRFAKALRIDLGDWRDRISWPKPIFTDLVARSDFYIERGFDPALTDFPSPAFEESLDIAELRGEPPALVDLYGAPIPPSEDDEEEDAFVRTNVAHDWLQRFETQLRRFIDQAMTNAFGPDWPKRRLPNDMLEEWQDKKLKAEANGGPIWPLISYADFTDYERVICKRDNWREVFVAILGRPESVRESFQRLYVPRISTMHSRPITQDDELLVYVEVRRFMKVILE